MYGQRCALAADLLERLSGKDDGSKLSKSTARGGCYDEFFPYVYAVDSGLIVRPHFLCGEAMWRMRWRTLALGGGWTRYGEPVENTCTSLSQKIRPLEAHRSVGLLHYSNWRQLVYGQFR